MHPQICTIGPFTIYSYGLMLSIAFIVSVSLASHKAKDFGVNSEIVFGLCFNAFVWGIIGARVLYVLQDLFYFLGNPREIIMLQHGGLSWFGGLIAGSISGLIYLKSKKLEIANVLDLLAPYIALGHAIGRIGCYLNGCCYGGTIIPAQILSSFFLLIIFLTLRFLQERKHKSGQIFFSYLFLYSFKRFFMEFVRVDNPHIFWGFSLFQVISLAIFIFAGIMLFRLMKNKE